MRIALAVQEIVRIQLVVTNKLHGFSIKPLAKVLWRGTETKKVVPQIRSNNKPEMRKNEFSL